MNRKSPAPAPEAIMQLAAPAGAVPLRLDHARLKQRLCGVPNRREKADDPAFIELIRGGPATLGECLVEFESATGSKLRIEWKSAANPD
jgi:hypothetical protein